MLRKIFVLIFFTYLGCNTVISQEDNSWKFVREDHGIKVFTSKSADSPIKEVKAQMLMHTTLSALVTLIKDVGNHHNWVYANINARILKQESNFSWVFYGQSEAPWPVSDRDIVANVTLHQDLITKEVTSIGIGQSDLIPEVEDFVRIPTIYSSWTFTPKGSGNIMVEFVLKMDVGGNVPAWLVNLTISKGPFITMNNMSHELEKPEYKNAIVSYIRE